VENHTDDDDDAGWKKLLTRPPDFFGNPISRDIWEQVGGMEHGMRILHISIRDISTDL
jgi:hypothetical protein